MNPDFLKDKVVLDAGCGAGRNSIFVSETARIVIGFDASEKAVDAASLNVEGLGMAVVVEQEDIYALPLLWDGAFDYVMSIGVLHHLPAPEVGFRKLVATLKHGGAISIWVYSRRDNRLALLLYEPLRKLTTRIPHSILYGLSLLPAVFVEVCNRMRLPLFRHYSVFPFSTKWNDAFDMLSAPSAKYYDKQEIQRWYEHAGLKGVIVRYHMMGGKAKGISAFGVKI